MIRATGKSRALAMLGFLRLECILFLRGPENYASNKAGPFASGSQVHAKSGFKKWPLVLDGEANRCLRGPAQMLQVLPRRLGRYRVVRCDIRTRTSHFLKVWYTS